VEWTSNDTLRLLYFLLPGFLAAWIFYGLTAHPKKEAFERVVQALIFTFLVKTLNVVVRYEWWIHWHPRRPQTWWDDEKELISSTILAILLGLVVAVAANWDLVHRCLRFLKITKRTSYPSEWYSVFHRFRREVILHLKGDRRLAGYPEEWPDQCDKGHFLLIDSAWVDDIGKLIRLHQVKRFVIPACEVERVELICTPEELKKPVSEIIEEQKALVQMHEKKESDHGQQNGTDDNPERLDVAD
jgi:Family of unknown function (DUF6338)